jgi:hypothetical protein
VGRRHAADLTAVDPDDDNAVFAPDVYRGAGVSYSALAPVSAALYGALNVAALTALAPGGVCDDVAQSTGVSVRAVRGDRDAAAGVRHAARDRRRLARSIDLRVHVFSQYQGLQEAQGILAKVVELLEQPVAVTGFSSWAIFYDGAIPVGDELVAGVKCKELVGTFPARDREHRRHRRLELDRCGLGTVNDA